MDYNPKKVEIPTNSKLKFANKRHTKGGEICETSRFIKLFYHPTMVYNSHSVLTKQFACH